MALRHSQKLLWTIDDYERMYRLGILPEDAHLELIEGEIVHMPPMLTPHANAVTHTNRLMLLRFDATHWVRVQCPLNIPPLSQPEPDVALIPKGGDESAHPTRADLIIEVADSSLPYDRGEKASLYARAGQPELWIVNLIDGVLEVYRNPSLSPGTTYGYAYRTTLVAKPDEKIAPLMAPEAFLHVADLF